MIKPMYSSEHPLREEDRRLLLNNLMGVTELKLLNKRDGVVGLNGDNGSYYFIDDNIKFMEGISSYHLLSETGDAMDLHYLNYRPVDSFENNGPLIISDEFIMDCLHKNYEVYLMALRGLPLVGGNDHLNCKQYINMNEGCIDTIIEFSENFIRLVCKFYSTSKYDFICAGDSLGLSYEQTKQILQKHMNLNDVLCVDIGRKRYAIQLPKIKIPMIDELPEGTDYKFADVTMSIQEIENSFTTYSDDLQYLYLKTRAIVSSSDVLNTIVEATKSTRESSDKDDLNVFRNTEYNRWECVYTVYVDDAAVSFFGYSEDSITGAISHCFNRIDTFNKIHSEEGCAF